MSITLKHADEAAEKLGQVIYVAGSQWGDEGKGKLVDILSQQYDIIARAAGGANAGHTIYLKNDSGESKKFVFHLMPSGVLHEGKVCLIGNGTVIHVPTLFKEINQLKEHGIQVEDRLLISDRAHMLFDYHKEIDGIQEDQKGDKKVGTTKRGIGPAYTDKTARRGIRMGDLLDFELFTEKFTSNAQKHMKDYGIDIDIDAQINFYKDASDTMKAMIVNTMAYLDKAYQDGKKILAEGAQGSHLDIDYGTYPYVTSSNTTSGGACTGLALAPNKMENVVGIVKAYTTRVGAGPFPTELDNNEGQMLRDQGGEYGATTGRPRRCGWFDGVVVKEAVIINGITSINLTKLDVLTGFKELKIATSYKLNGQTIDHIPASLKSFEEVEVMYETLPGWDEDLTDIRSFEALPENAQNYVKRIEELVGVRVNFIGIGMCRDEMIFR